MSGRIRVEIQWLEHPSQHDVTRSLELSDEVAHEVFRPVDHPSPDANSFIRQDICTSSGEIDRVKERRMYVAKMLAEEIADAVYEAMERRDTVMGYPK